MLENLPVITGEVCIGIINDIAHSPMLYLLLGLIVLDFISGKTKALMTGQYSSKIGLDGLIKHSLIILLVLFLKFFGRLFGLETVVYTMVAMFSLDYLVSVVENLEAMGIKFPKWVSARLKQMQDDADKVIRIDKNDEVIVRKNSDRKGVDR